METPNDSHVLAPVPSPLAEHVSSMPEALRRAISDVERMRDAAPDDPHHVFLEKGRGIVLRYYPPPNDPELVVSIETESAALWSSVVMFQGFVPESIAAAACGRRFGDIFEMSDTAFDVLADLAVFRIEGGHMPHATLKCRLERPTMPPPHAAEA